MTTPNRTRRTGFVLATAIVLACPGVRADIIGEWTQDPNVSNLFRFEYEVTALPDFDQRRDTVANCGVNYCVPTATMNIMAYAANHGFPNLIVQPDAWFNDGSYAAVTNGINEIATCMNTDSFIGTYTDAWYYGLAGCPFPPSVCQALGLCNTPLLPKDMFTVSLQLGSGQNGPRMYQVVKSAIQHKGLVAVKQGWYQNFGWCGSYQQMVRAGGHALTLQKVSGHWYKGSYAQTAYGGTMWLRDPGSDEGSPQDPDPPCNANDPTTQSKHDSGAYSFGLMSVFKDPFCALGIRYERITFPGDQAFRLIDGYFLIHPKAAYSFTDGPPTIHVHTPTTFEGPPSILSFALPDADLYTDMVMSVDGDRYAFIVNGQVQLFDPLIQAMVPLDPTNLDLVDPTALIYGRRRGLYVIDGDDIVSVNMDIEPPAEIARVAPPNPCRLLVYDDLADRLVAISTEARRLFRYEYGLFDWAEQDIPESVPFEGEVMAQISPADGALWWGTSKHTALYRITSDPDGNLQAFAFTLPTVQSPPEAFDVDDAGHLFVSEDGQIMEFVYNDETAELELVPDSPFAGLPSGSILRMTHSRTNYDPELHSGPGWEDVFPTTSAPAIDDCAADLDRNGAVGFSDVLIVLASWGTPVGDVDYDGNTGFSDVLRILAGWGPCPVTPTYFATDQCLGAALVREGVHPFSNVDADTDGPVLPRDCDEGAGLAFGHDIWLFYSPSSSGIATVSTCGTADYDTRMAAYTGGCDDLTLIACNDDAAGCGLASLMQFAVTVGEPVLIRVGGYNVAQGTGTLSISVD